MEIDRKLIIDAENKNTGATVHAVNEAICNYEISVNLANGTAWWVKPEKNTQRLRNAGKASAESWEKFLRIFVATGDVKKEYRGKIYL